MKTKPLISVIVPVYNTEKYLKKCIDSIIMQTYKEFELFLVDDGSTDSCPMLCDEYAVTDSRVKVIHKKNEGQGRARNMALDAASGKYISFIDSDDWIVPDMFEKMINAAEQYSADIVFCGIAVFNGLKITENRYFEGVKLYDNNSLMKDFISTPYIHSGPCNKLFSRFLFDKIRFPDIRAREDAYIMHEILGQCKTGVHLGECLYIQFVRPESTEQKKFNSNKLILLDCADRLQQYVAEYFPDLYHFVELKHANEIVYLMDEIVNSFSFIKYRELYKKLKIQLKEERGRIAQKEASIEPAKMKHINQACDFGTLFFLKSLTAGIKRRLKKILIGLLSKGNGAN